VIVFNHVSYVDAAALAALFAPCAVAKSGVARLPLVGTFAVALQVSAPSASVCLHWLSTWGPRGVWGCARFAFRSEALAENARGPGPRVQAVQGL
jgi:hypothetical protein